MPWLCPDCCAMRSYGDISPTTPFGRVIVVILIVVSLVIFPSQLAGLLDLVASIPRYRKKFRRRRDVQHVILVGGGGVASVASLRFRVLVARTVARISSTCDGARVTTGPADDNPHSRLTACLPTLSPRSRKQRRPGERAGPSRGDRALRPGVSD